MKKYLLVFASAVVCLALSISLSACGGSDDSIDDKYTDVWTYSFTGTQGNVPDHKFEQWKNDFTKYSYTTGEMTAATAKKEFDTVVNAVKKDTGAMEDIEQFKKDGYEGFSITLWMKDSKGRVLCQYTFQ